VDIIIDGIDNVEERYGELADNALTSMTDKIHV
jgi:hypothetical protein